MANDNSKYIEALQDAVDAENMLYFCLSHLVTLLKSGRLRTQMEVLVKEAAANKNELSQLLSGLGVNDFIPKERCKSCNIRAESFSSLGLFSLSLEAIGLQEKIYKLLVGLTVNAQEKNLFKKILAEKSKQKAFLKKEKGLADEEASGCSALGKVCIPDIISKFWT